MYSDAGKLNALLGPRELKAYDNRGGGHLTLRNREGEKTIQLNGHTGEIIGITKSFAERHPDNPHKQIVYASLEGPEAAVYVRGTGKLRQGRAEIHLPEHFSLVASAVGMTVHLTPRSIDSKGLAVIASSPQDIHIAELDHGAGDYEFDYLVHGIRRGKENFQVIRDLEP